MKRMRAILISISTPMIVMLLFYNVLAAPGPGGFHEIICDIDWTTQYTITNTGGSPSTSVHVFYDESGAILGSPVVPLPTGGSELLVVGDHVPPGYDGYAIVSSDLPYSITMEAGPGALLQASFEAGPPTGVAPHTVTFTNTSSGYDMSFWEFGNGVTSTLDSPTYTYTMAGTYVVTLTASKSGCLITTPQFNPTATTYIFVEEGNPKLFLPAVFGE